MYTQTLYVVLAWWSRALAVCTRYKCCAHETPNNCGKWNADKKRLTRPGEMCTPRTWYDQRMPCLRFDFASDGRDFFRLTGAGRTGEERESLSWFECVNTRANERGMEKWIILLEGIGGGGEQSVGKRSVLRVCGVQITCSCSYSMGKRIKQRSEWNWKVLSIYSNGFFLYQKSHASE